MKYYMFGGMIAPTTLNPIQCPPIKIIPSFNHNGIEWESNNWKGNLSAYELTTQVDCKIQGKFDPHGGEVNAYDDLGKEYELEKESDE